VGDAPVPRGTPSGVTLMQQGSPVIYIHEDNIRKWVNGGDIGNLLATIRHEAIHADQNVRQNRPVGEHLREFEAYATEISHVQELFAAGEDTLLPSSAHLAATYDAATEHYGQLLAPVPANLAVMKETMDKEYPKLKRCLEENDLDSGRVERIAAATRTALHTYIGDPRTTYPRLAYNDYSLIPDQFRKNFDKEFSPLFDRAHAIYIKRR
jgi:hypothetical protein